MLIISFSLLRLMCAHNCTLGIVNGGVAQDYGGQGTTSVKCTEIRYDPLTASMSKSKGTLPQENVKHYCIHYLK